MNVALNPYWQSMAAPWQQRKTERGYWVLIVIFVLLSLVGGIFALMGDFDRRSILFGLGFCSWMLIVVAWTLQLVGAMQCNHPQHVRLVPRYLLVQRRALLALWLGAAVLQAPLIWLCWPKLYPLSLFIELRSPTNAFVVSAALLWALGAQVRWPWLLLVVWITGVTLVQYAISEVGFKAAVMPLLLGHPNLAGTMLMVAMAWLLTRVILRDGSRSHRNAYQLGAEVRRFLLQDPKAKTPDLLFPGIAGNQWLQVFAYPYTRYVQWQLAHATPTRRSVVARLDIGAAGAGHWVKQLSNVLWPIAFMGLATWIAQTVWGLRLWDVFVSAGAIGGLMIGAAVGPTIGLRNSMLRGRHQHGLLVLLPGVPSGVELNRTLAKRHLFQLVVLWLAMAFTLVAVPWGAQGSNIAWLVWTACVPVLPLALQDWSRLHTLRFAEQVGVMAQHIAWLPVVCVMHYSFNIGFLWIAAVSVAAFAIHAAWRWRKLATYPQALPAGRLAV